MTHPPAHVHAHAHANLQSEVTDDHDDVIGAPDLGAPDLGGAYRREPAVVVVLRVTE
jgi:hypothetical protein